MATIRRFKKTASFLVTMGSNVENPRVPWVNNDVIHEKPGTIEIVEKLPGPARVSGGIHLSIECAEIESIRIVWIHYQAADITPRRAVGSPIIRIFTGRVRYYFGGRRFECRTLRNKAHW